MKYLLVFFLILATCVITSLVTAVLLILSHQAFPTKIISGDWWKSILIALSGIVLSIIVGLFFSFLTYHESVPISGRLLYILKEIIEDFRFLLPLGNDIFSFTSYSNLWVSNVISLTITSSLIITFIVFTSSKDNEKGATASQELAIRKLIKDQTNIDSLSYFSTRRDKKAIFSKNRKAAVTYSLFGNVLLASGDPIGKPNSWENAIFNFISLSRKNGWTPAVVGASVKGAEAYNKAGLKSTVFGDESVIVVDSFSLENPGMKSVSKSMQRAQKKKYEIRIQKQGTIARDALKQIKVLSEKWRDGKDRGFSMALGRIGDPTDEELLIVTAQDADGVIQGILSFVPAGPTGLSLDTMRRSPNSMNGVIAYMIASLVDFAKDNGISEISLNFAAARHFFLNGESIEANIFDKTLRKVMKFFSQWYQLESLYISNDIYLPEWRTRYICYDRGALTSVLFAIGQAEGFVPKDITSQIKRIVSSHSNASNVNKKWWENSDFIKDVHVINETKKAEKKVKATDSEMRLNNLVELENIGIHPFSSPEKNVESVGNVQKKYENMQQFDDNTHYLRGKIKKVRTRGAISFADIIDNHGEIQLVLKKDLIDNYANELRYLEKFDIWKSYINPGDIIDFSGKIMRTSSGKLSIEVNHWKLIAKALRDQTSNALVISEENLNLINRTNCFKERFINSGYVEVTSFPYRSLLFGFEKIFYIDFDKALIINTYQNKDTIRQFVTSTVDFVEIISSKNISSDPREKNDLPKIQEAKKYGLPPFALVEVSFRTSKDKNDR